MKIYKVIAFEVQLWTTNEKMDYKICMLTEIQRYWNSYESIVFFFFSAGHTAEAATKFYDNRGIKY